MLAYEVYRKPARTKALDAKAAQRTKSEFGGSLPTKSMAVPM